MNKVKWTNKKYQDNVDWFKKKGPKPKEVTKYGLTYRHPHLYYNNKPIIRTDKRNEKLRSMFVKKNVVLGTSRDSLYEFVKERMWNIPRSAVMNFIKAQPILNKLRPAPSLMKTKGTMTHTWRGKKGHLVIGMDLVDLGQNCFPKNFKTKYKSLLVVVHPATNFGFVRPLENSQAATVLREFKVIQLKFVKRFAFFPKIIQSDSGNEFRGVFEDWRRDQGITTKFVRLVPYVEAFNARLQSALVFMITGLRHSGNLKEYIKWALLRVHSKKYSQSGMKPEDAVKKIKANKLEYMKSLKKINISSTGAKPRTYKVGELVRFYLGKGKENTLYKKYNGLINSTSSSGSRPISKKVKNKAGEEKRKNIPHPHWSDEIFKITKIMNRLGIQYLKLNKNPSRIYKTQLLEMPREMRKWYNPGVKFIPSFWFQHVLEPDKETAKIINANRIAFNQYHK